ncbi:MAG: DUF2069 domain-containing protein [Spongiibacteraceae bacterium]
MPNQYAVLARYARFCAVLSYFALLVLLTLGTLVWPSCNRSPNLSIWGLQVLLLLPFLPAILQQKVRPLAWLTFILLGFFLAAVPTAFACGSWLTVSEPIVTVVLFIALMMNIRWRARALKEQ